MSYYYKFDNCMILAQKVIKRSMKHNIILIEEYIVTKKSYEIKTSTILEKSKIFVGNIYIYIYIIIRLH